MNPLQIQVTRGNAVESEHIVDAVVVDTQGKIVRANGNIDSLVFPRSAIKMIQALGFAESGALDKFELTEKELSLACASHLGQDIHLLTVRAWLSKLGLTSENLECGAHKPYDEDAYVNLIRAGKSPERVHNNCSGKHSGILSACLAYKEPTKGYSKYDHPAQVRLRKILGELSNLSYEKSPWGVDGCGIPTYAIPLKAIADSMAKLLPEAKVSADRSAAAKKILHAVKKYPEMISGVGGLCTEVIQISKGQSLLKTGAEGVYTALIPSKGLSIAIKCRDGASRASQVAILHLLHQLGGLTDSQREELRPYSDEIIRNWEKLQVGSVVCR